MFQVVLSWIIGTCYIHTYILYHGNDSIRPPCPHVPFPSMYFVDSCWELASVSCNFQLLFVFFNSFRERNPSVVSIDIEIYCFECRKLFLSSIYPLFVSLRNTVISNSGSYYRYKSSPIHKVQSNILTLQQ